MDILKCIIWDFDTKSGYFLFLLSILQSLEVNPVSVPQATEFNLTLS